MSYPANLELTCREKDGSYYKVLMSRRNVAQIVDAKDPVVYGDDGPPHVVTSHSYEELKAWKDGGEV